MDGSVEYDTPVTPAHTEVKPAMAGIGSVFTVTFFTVAVTAVHPFASV